MNDMLTKLGIARALQKEAGKYVDAFREPCDAELERMFKDSGGTADRMTIRINGQKVGELTVSCTTESREERLEVTDWEAFREWLFTDDEELVKWFCNYVGAHPREFARWYFEQTGEKPDGCDLVETYTPGGEFKNTTLRGCTVAGVSKALGVPLVNEVAALLEAGD